MRGIPLSLKALYKTLQYLRLLPMLRSGDSSVDIVTRLRSGRQKKNRCSIPDYLLQNVHTESEGQPVTYPVCTGSKVTGHEADR